MAESAVVGYSHAILGEGIFAYVILREDGKSVPEEKLINELKQNVKQKIAGYAVPHGILVYYFLDILKSNITCIISLNIYLDYSQFAQNPIGKNHETSFAQNSRKQAK